MASYVEISITHANVRSWPHLAGQRPTGMYQSDPVRIAQRLMSCKLLETMARQPIASGTVHRMPADLRKAIESDPAVAEVWASITPLARNEWICWVTSARKDETRNRRIEVGLDKMRKGMRRPCCWPGCPHR
jgi:hypothetical protein